MDTIDLIALWEEQNQKIVQTLNINKQLLKDNLEGKTKTVMSRLKSIRIVGIVFGVIWCALMLFILIVSWHQTNWFFKSALIIHIAVSLAAIGLYIYHLVLLDHFNNNQSVFHAQEQLLKLQLSNLKTVGILWLQLPVFSMWLMSNAWLQNDPTTFWFVQTPIVLTQAVIGIWIYKNLNIKNHEKKWFKWFMSKGEFGRIKKASELLNEIEELKSSKYINNKNC